VDDLYRQCIKGCHGFHRIWLIYFGSQFDDIIRLR
jgi:hypothetical protein